MATSAEDADALFGGGPEPAPPPSTAAPAFPEPPPPPVENRREHRVKVSWPARIQLPNGKVVEVRVRDLSDIGVGLLTPVALPASAELVFAMGMPSPTDPARIAPVTGILRTSYNVMQGRDIHCGGSWVQLAPEARELITSWMRRHKR